MGSTVIIRYLLLGQEKARSFAPELTAQARENAKVEILTLILHQSLKMRMQQGESKVCKHLYSHGKRRFPESTRFQHISNSSFWSKMTQDQRLDFKPRKNRFGKNIFKTYTQISYTLKIKEN
jgi:hypothetical protein